MKKTLAWIGLAAAALLIAFTAIAYVFLVCEETNGIGRYSPLCYLCVSPAIRNVPLVGLKGDPIYATNREFQDGYVKPASSSVKFVASKSPSEIIESTTAYFNSLGFKTEKVGCANKPECVNCCVWFSGENSGISVSIDPQTAANGYSPADTNHIWINETFKVMGKYE